MKRIFALAVFQLITAIVSAQTVQDVSFKTRPDAGYSVQIDPPFSCVIDPHDFVCN